MRTLTDNERNVLAHVVIDPDGWWTHANDVVKIDEEEALAAKVARWQAPYDTASIDPDYKTRAEREAE
jgi:hypothetical protein